MRQPAARRILILSVLLFLAAGGAARAGIVEPIGEEQGRELLGPDGRTFIDKQDGFSIVLPSPDWKVRLEQGEPYADVAGFGLALALPNGQVLVRISGKIYPLPTPLETIQKVVADPKLQPRALSNKIIEVGGVKCLENEVEDPKGSRPSYELIRICDKNSMEKFVLHASPDIDKWPAQERDLRELFDSFRILR